MASSRHLQVQAGLTDTQIQATLLGSDIMSGISAAGSLFIVLCYFRFTHLRKFAFTLVAILSFTDILNQLTEFVQPSAQELDLSRRTGLLTAGCWFQALTDSFFELSSVLWTSAIAATLYLVVFKRMDQATLYSQLKWMCLVCYGMPLVLMLLPLTDNAYGVSGAWCWIPSDGKGGKGVIWQFVVFYIPLILAIIFNTVVYVRTYSLLRRTVANVGESDTAAAQLRLVMKRLQLYPVVLTIIWAPAIINRVYEASTGKQVFALYFTQRVFSSSQGLWNALVYGLSQGVKEAIQGDLAKAFPAYFSDPTVATAATDLLRREASLRNNAAGFKSSGKGARDGNGEGDGLPLRAAGVGDAADDEEDDEDIRVHLPPRRAASGLEPSPQRPAVTVVNNPAAIAATASSGSGMVDSSSSTARQGRVQAMLGKTAQQHEQDEQGHRP